MASIPRRGRPILPDMEQFALTERAAARIAEIVAAEGHAGRAARCRAGRRVQRLPVPLRAGQDAAGGRPGDRAGGAKVLVDPASLDLLAGSELDYTDELMGSHFAVRNPNAKSACGCGTSFSSIDPHARIAATKHLSGRCAHRPVNRSSLRLAMNCAGHENRHLERQLDPPAGEARRKLAGTLPARRPAAAGDQVRGAPPSRP